jgi:hypothetical protein
MVLNSLLVTTRCVSTLRFEVQKIRLDVSKFGPDLIRLWYAYSPLPYFIERRLYQTSSKSNIYLTV